MGVEANEMYEAAQKAASDNAEGGGGGDGQTIVVDDDDSGLQVLGEDAGDEAVDFFGGVEELKEMDFQVMDYGREKRGEGGEGGGDRSARDGVNDGHGENFEMPVELTKRVHSLPLSLSISLSLCLFSLSQFLVLCLSLHRSTSLARNHPTPHRSLGMVVR